MRIGTKLFLTYLILLGLFAAGVSLGLPRMVTRIVLDTEQQRLEKDAHLVATQLNRLIGTRKTRLVVPDAAFSSLADVILGEAQTLAIVNPRGVVIKATKPEFEQQRIPDKVLAAKLAEKRQGPQVHALGKLGTFLFAAEPLGQDEPLLRDWSVVVMRDMDRIQNLAQPLNRRLIPLVALALLASLAVAGLLSREMVKRLRSTGEAARSLAEGDLSRRAPTQGGDEITELAHHFNHMAERIEALVAGLRRSEQSRKDLLVTVSHELRTPLTSIQGFAEALRDGVVRGDERQKRYFEIIANESARLTRLINDVFDVAKMEAGQVELRLQALGVASWLVEFADGFLPVAESAGVTLTVDLSPEAERARVHGDKDRLGQVLGNLVGNAVRFSPAGEPVIIRSRVEGDEVVVEVIDRGPGLPPTEPEHVFDRFYQGANKGGEHKGAGLGLAIVKSLVEAHGGSVGVHSQPDQGATFWFRLKQYKA